MNRRIGVKNFRVFKDYTEFEIRPLTFLIGPNNSGKSSVTKLMRMLSNGMDKLNFDKGSHNLISFDSVLNNNSQSKEIEITLESNIAFIGPGFYTRLTYKNGIVHKISVEQGQNVLLEIGSVKEMLPHNRQIDFNSALVNLDLEFLIDLVYDKKIYLNLYNSYTTIPPDYDHRARQIHCDYLYQLDKIGLNETYNGVNLFDMNWEEFQTIGSNDYAHSVYPLEGQQEDEYTHGWRLAWQAIYNEIDQLEKDYLLFNIYINDKDVTKNYKDDILKIQEKVSKGFKSGFFAWLGLFEDKNYSTGLGKFQMNIEKEIQETLGDENIDIRLSRLGFLLFENNIGGYFAFSELKTVSLLDSFNLFSFTHPQLEYIKHLSSLRGHQNRVLENQSNFEIDKLVKKYYQKEYADLNNKSQKFVKQSSSLFGIDGGIDIKRHEDFISVVKLKANGKVVNLADHGFGFSQVLPLILFLATNISFPFETSLIIEEPESNLHPNFQSNLADLLVLFKKVGSSSNIIIETHSEYLIRKLQYLVASNQIDKNDIIIHYFNDDQYVTKEEPKVKHIEITSNGNLTENFGPGFYDETTRLQFDLLRVNQEQKN